MTNLTNEEIWRGVLSEMEVSLSRASFVTWFKDTKIISKENGQIVISVPNGFVKEWIQNKFNKQIFQQLKQIDNDVREINYVVGNPFIKNADPKIFTKEIPLEQIQETSDTDIDPKTNLNRKYTLDNFVVGANNELAYAASMAVAKNLGKTYNPFFIYGGVGLGKTHLLQGIANKIMKDNPDKRIIYLPAEKMVSELIEGLKNKTIEDVKMRYVQKDVLIVDDVQFLAAKETTQEIFFATFNNLYNRNKQIILSSDRAPKALSAIEERLKSRFEGGMIADIGIPAYETRLAILKMKMKSKPVVLPDEILEYIAVNIQKNIRELEGALNRIVAVVDLTGREPTLKDVEKLLKAYIQASYRKTSAQTIIKTVCDFYGITLSDLLKKSRKTFLVRPRQIAMYLLREDTKASFPDIGSRLGGKDHSTVIHAYRKIIEEADGNESLKQEINLIRERIYNKA
ncbi:MAG: chromosomal replication initiator protein [Parcubacteria group bacterium Gr01-1014_2]|nr:MAG: chromosomal replication initiator protein [Parcubacteria group bacterium Gr01-1014_2]